LSQYWFHNGFFQGPFDVFNEPYPDGDWAWISAKGDTRLVAHVTDRVSVPLHAQSHNDVPDPSVIAVRPQVPGVPADPVSGIPGRAGGSGFTKGR
jgi:hypothetical protein